MNNHATILPDSRFAQEEDDRLEALDDLDVLDTPREEGFDRIARIVRNVLNVPVASISVIDAHRQWYKSCEGLELNEIPREEAICSTTIEQMRPLVVNDLRLDARFADLPVVAGEPFMRFYAGVPLCTADGYNIGTLCAVDYEPREFSRNQLDILKDLAKLAMAQFEMRQLVKLDALTGVLSRRALKEEGASALALARRHEMEMSCVLIDIDHFKGINDRFGHPAGDNVLSSAAGYWREMLRRSDSIGRLGGEEFCVILPHTDLAGAMDVAEKLRAAIESLVFEGEGYILHATASFGVATLDPEVDDIDALITRADRALYEAKNTGRNRCVAWKRSDDGQERGPRRRVLKAGQIRFDKRPQPLDCTIRFLAEDGAGIDVSSSAGIPDTFTLNIAAEDTEKRCRVTSRTEKHIEVLFV